MVLSNDDDDDVKRWPKIPFDTLVNSIVLMFNASMDDDQRRAIRGKKPLMVVEKVIKRNVKAKLVIKDSIEEDLRRVIRGKRPLMVEEEEKRNVKGKLVIKDSMDEDQIRRAIRGKRPMVEEEENRNNKGKLVIKGSINEEDLRRALRGKKPMVDEEEERNMRMIVNNKLALERRRLFQVKMRRNHVTEPEVQERRRRNTPEWLVDVMREYNGEDAKLILEKEYGLTATDVNRKQARLLMPWNRIVDNDFLNKEELKIIDKHYRGINKTGLDVVFVDCSGVTWNLNLRRWDMKTSSNYVLAAAWSHVIDHNKLRKGHPMQLWSFRSPEGLYFAMAPLDASPSSTSVTVSDPYAASTSATVTVPDPYAASSSISAMVLDPYAASSSTSTTVMVHGPYAASTSAPVTVHDPYAASAPVTVPDPYATSAPVTVPDPYATSSSTSARVPDLHVASSSSSARVPDPHVASSSARVPDPHAASSSSSAIVHDPYAASSSSSAPVPPKFE